MLLIIDDIGSRFVCLIFID